MSYTYIKSLSVDFGGVLANHVLFDSINNAGIGPVSLRVDVVGDVVNIVFDIEPSPAEKIIIDGIIAAHLIPLDIEYGLYGELAAESTTTSLTYQNKYTLNIPNIIAGYYILTWYIDVANTNPAKGTNVRIELNNVTLTEHGFPSFDSTIEWTHMSGFKRIYLDGTHYIDVDYRNTDVLGAAKIKEVTLLLTKVSF